MSVRVRLFAPNNADIVQKREQDVAGVKMWIGVPLSAPTTVREWPRARTHDPCRAGSIPALTSSESIAQRQSTRFLPGRLRGRNSLDSPNESPVAQAAERRSYKADVGSASLPRVTTFDSMAVTPRSVARRMFCGTGSMNSRPARRR